jgi:hypothetical protein
VRERLSCLFVLVSFAATTFLCCGGLFYASVHGPAVKLERLLTGDDNVEVASLIFTGQQQRVELSDPATAAYITRAMRAAVYDGFVPDHRHGYTYCVEVRFASGGSACAGCWVVDNASELLVSPNADDLFSGSDMYYYLVTFPEPVPEPLAQTIAKLRRPWFTPPQ